MPAGQVRVRGVGMREGLGRAPGWDVAEEGATRLAAKLSPMGAGML